MIPQRHHIDRRAASVAGAGAGDDEDLLSTIQASNWTGLSPEWFETARSKGYGPAYIKIGRLVRYRRGTVKEWLLSRTRSRVA